jgi:hypothetical protein
MGLGNDFEKIEENILKWNKILEKKNEIERKEKLFVVYQNSYGSSRFKTLNGVKKYLEEMLPDEFTVTSTNGLDEDDPDFKEFEYEIKTTVKIIKREKEKK